MKTARELLKERYIDQLKTSDDLFIGVEFEFPIVNLTGQATDTSVTRGLFDYLASLDSFEAVHTDQEGRAIELRHLPSQDHIVFEVSYNLIEFAFEKASKIQEIEHRFEEHLALIQPWLRERQHEIQGNGIHPSWNKNDNRPVKTERYEMLISFLELGLTQGRPGFHTFADYGGFICGSQVQLDVTADNYLRVLNAFNKVEAAKAYLFANSPFDGADWDTLISRDRFWEDSMHGYYPENIGIFPEDFTDTEDFLDWMEESAIYNVQRDSHLYYFTPIRAKDYLSQDSITAYTLDGQTVSLTPSPDDFKWHRAYHYQDLTKRGTVEFRSTCAQPLEQSFTPIAFHVGLMANLDQLEELLKAEPLFAEFDQDYKAMRRYFSKPQLAPDQLKAIHRFSQKLLACAQEGLEKRGYGEESYLEDLIQRLQQASLR